IAPTLPNVTNVVYCQNMVADTLNALATLGDTLLWYGTNETGGIGTSTSIKPSTTTIGSTNYYVSQVDIVSGCEGPRSKIVVTINPILSKPSIEWNGTQFTATTTSTGVNYQWLFSNSSISGATNATYKPTAIGSYKIQITGANACKNLSDSFMLVVTAVNPTIETSSNHIAKILPNPASSDVILYFQQKPNKTLTIQLLNLKGQVLKHTNTNSQSTHISLSEIISGNYIIKIIGKDYNQTQQLLILK
ncbi:MAG: T9SS type A sorting domain-containing protein, partial [Candidatus Kapabacteria bacterium]|nr:T9SS type A sorting domain-containing protein [Candidatus Kapabacteria bacterium]